MVGVSILVVDDVSLVLSVTSRMLETVGFTVSTAQSGDEALEVLARQGGNVDVVVTDVNMPGMNGIDLAKEIATTYSTIGVLLVSGKESMTEVMRQLPTHYGFLRKPYKLETLEAAIERVVASC